MTKTCSTLKYLLFGSTVCLIMASASSVDARLYSTAPAVRALGLSSNAAITRTLDERMKERESTAESEPYAFGPWAQGLYNKTHSSQGVGFTGYTQGGTGGFDLKITKSALLGVGYAYMATDIKSDAYKTNAYGDHFFVYGKYQPTYWYMQGVLTYGTADYKQDITHEIGKYTVDTYGGQFQMGFDKDGFDNYSAIRYTYVNPDNYLMGTEEIEQKNSQVLTAVIGSKIYTKYTWKKMKFRPEFRVAILYDLKSNRTPAVVTPTGTNFTYRADGKRLKRFGGEAGVGLTTSLYGFDIGLSYDVELRSKYSAQTGMVDLTYNF